MQASRAGLDYRELADVSVHESLEACFESMGRPRWFAFATRSAATHDSASYRAGEVPVSGAETRGLLPEGWLPAAAGSAGSCRRAGNRWPEFACRQSISDLIARFISAYTASRGGLPS